ncbi:hypothetical protein SKAU_G00179390 [Synaphobranchus kaupii]|uniref:FYVE-type domain-containing protein n=1 Tax=Synaphobranchus kaupii TaxID=118154 RepID=A0A9Q1FLZ9_SYNKA|nr:hypothetical protein SKAU_G00179390 [Synaphobranchus kaupii]
MPRSRVNSDSYLYASHTREGDSERLTFHIFNTVTTFRKLMLFLEPVNISCRLVKYLLGWKICSLLCCVLLNVFFLNLSEEAWLILGLLCVFAPAALGFLKGYPRGTATKLARQRKMEDLEMEASLREMEEMLSQVCLSAESAYSILCWERCVDSALFYGGLLALLFLLYTAPGSYTLVVTNSALFLWKGSLYGVVRKTIFWRSSETSEGHFENVEKTTSPGTEDISSEDIEENVDADELDAGCDFKDAIEDGDDDEDMPLMGRRGALVGKIPDFHQKGRKRAIKPPRLHPSNNSGNCSRCHTSFSVLKKKKSCSNCGSFFCSRCCCKVQKSYLDNTILDSSRGTARSGHFLWPIRGRSPSQEAKHKRPTLTAWEIGP